MKKKKEETYKTMRGRIRRVKSIHTIPYKRLHKAGITHLLFDFDYTLGPNNAVKLDKKTKKLLLKLKKTFAVLVYSNNAFHAGRRRKYFEEIGIQYRHTIKPFYLEYRVLPYDAKPILIGDKLTTDGIYAALRNIPCLLVHKKSLSWIQKF